MKNKFDVAEPFEFELGKTVVIGFEDSTMVRVIDAAGQEVGRFEFKKFLPEPELGIPGSHKLVWTYLDLIDDTYKHKGLAAKS